MPSGRSGGTLMLLLILAAGLCIYLAACEEETVKRDYPRVKTLPVTEITNDGARFAAEIFEPGSGEINDHGFVWSVSLPNIQNDNKVSLGEFKGTGSYSAEITSTLSDGFTYKVCAYVRSGDYTVYGTPVEFTSLGSRGPVITGFFPGRTICGDTILIRGRSFSTVKNFNMVFFDETQGVICDPVSDTSLYAIVPFNTIGHEKTISVSVGGERTTFTDKKLLIDLPELVLGEPSSGHWGDTVNLFLKNLMLPETARIYFGAIRVTPLGPPEDTRVQFLVPGEATAQGNIIRVNISENDLMCFTPYILLPPRLDSISPSTGVWSSSVNLYGRFNTLQKDASVKFRSANATITYVSRDTVTVTVPDNLNVTPADVIYSYKTLSSNAVPFKLIPPEIISVTPLTGSAGTNIYIRCRNVRSQYLTVRLNGADIGHDMVTGPTYDDMTVQTRVRGDINGPAQLSISVCGQSDTLDVPFVVTNPYVESISPSTAVPGDTITIIAGNYIDYATTFRLTGTVTCNMPFVSRSGNNIKVLYPDCNTVSGSVSAYYFYNSVAVQIPSQVFLYQAEPLINSLEPLEVKAGDMVTVRGANFSKVNSFNKLSVNGKNVAVISSSPDEIRFILPDFTGSNCTVRLTVGGFTVTSQQTLTVDSPWESLPDVSFGNTAPFAMKFGDEVLAAVKLPTNSKRRVLYRFDASSGTFSKLSDKEYPLPLAWPGVVVKERTAYLFDRDLKPQLYKYDRDEDAMSLVGDYPGSNVGDLIILDGDSVLYMGGGYYYPSTYSLDFWKYNYSSGVWTKLKNLPGRTVRSNEFSVNGRCYIVTNTNLLFEYDPVGDSWIPRAAYPGYWCRYKVALESGGMAYLGFGDRISDLFHRYDPQTDTWERITVPTGYFHTCLLSFSLNDKVYMCENGTRFWSYDPSIEQ